ncbi:MAG: YraN family protein [Clostridia bacterium]|nr:YraN family protein [Clostridia bacterium]
MNGKASGNEGEKLAAAYLKKKKYKIIALNYFSRFGEIDIIAENKGVVAFVEVKKRKNDSFGAACEAVNGAKIGKIKKTALYWISQNPESALMPRFDVIEVYTDTKTINHIENAF